jgi:hypothetical protein
MDAEAQDKHSELLLSNASYTLAARLALLILPGAWRALGLLILCINAVS